MIVTNITCLLVSELKSVPVVLKTPTEFSTLLILMQTN